MPAVGVLIAGAVAQYAAGFTISSFLLSTASSLALSAITRALSPKPKKQNFANLSTRQSQTQNVRQPITSHKIVYGQTRVSGPFTFIGATQDNLYLHLVFPVAAHEIESVDEIWLNDYSIPLDALDANGNVTSGRYNGYARVRWKLGTIGQTADTALVSEVSEWTTSHKMQGIAYIYVRLRFNQDIFPGGIPNISAIIKGKKVLDTRDSVTRWSPNAALFQHDYLSNDDYGFGEENINLASVTAAANICDEFVTTRNEDVAVSSINVSSNIITLSGSRLLLAFGDKVNITTTGTAPAGTAISTDYYVVPYQFKDTPRIRLAASYQDALDGVIVDITDTGTGTHTIRKIGEPRYHGAGVIDTAVEIGENLKDLLSGSGGKAIYAGGEWIIKAAAYSAPTISLDENDFIAPLSIETKLTRRERFNTMKGIYYSHINDFQPTDYPAFSDASAVSSDGETIPKDFDLSITNRPYTAQRLIKIELKKARQEIVVKAQCNLRALQLQAGDTVEISNARMGWTNKVFEVTNFRFIISGDETPEIGVELTLRETASSVFDWSSSEESDIDTAPNTSLPNAFDVQAVTGLSFDSFQVETLGGDTIFRLTLGWDAHPDNFVLSGGRFEIQYKESAEVNFKPSFFVTGSIISSEIVQGSVNTEYDIRIRAVNNVGVASSWTSLLNVAVGTSGGVTSTEDWGLMSDSVTSSEDWLTYSDSVTSTEDWEYFV